MKNILKYICLFSMLVWFFPVCVHADTLYIVASSDTCEQLYLTDANDGSNDNNRYKYNFNNSNNDIRLTCARTSTGNIVYLFISENPFKYGMNSSGCPFGNTAYESVRYNKNDYLFYYKIYPQGDYSQKYQTVKLGNNTIPFCGITDFTTVSSGDYPSLEEVYDIIFNGVVPPEPINWGLLRDVEYSTRIAGNGTAAIRNVDYLKWDTVADANGNDISECEVEIQAVPGNFSGSTYENLLNQTYQNFNIGNYGAVNLGTLSATSGTFSVSWSYILNHLGWSMDSLYAHLENELWLKTGWYYQIRLLGSDGYTGQWQTMYTPLSQGAAASETVINQNSFNMNIYQVYEELTQINNNTSITINIEETDYTVQNPDDGDEPQEGTDLWDILKQMLNGIFQIVKNIAALPGKFFEMIKSLFMLPNDYSEFGERLDSEVNSYMEENQPGLIAIQEGTADIKETLESTSPSGSGQYPQCTFTWDAVTLDLTDFNAGTVTFFAAGSFDFTAAFIQMIEGFGMTYSDYQFYTSAVIYLWVVVFIYRHVNTFLKGGGETKSG